MKTFFKALHTTMLSVVFLGLILVHKNSLAQEYPYEETPAQSSALNNNSIMQEQTLEKKSPPGTSAPAQGNKNHLRYHALYRIGLKAAGNFTVLQSPSFTNSEITETYSGLGYEGNLSLSWDLPYQPIFLELETGYRQILMQSEINPIQIVPLTFGMHYRHRFGSTSLWKPGLKTSFELRFTQNSFTGQNDFSGNPVVSFSSLVEFGNFLVEPLITVARIQPQYSFLTFSLKTGFRF